jgi:hypothetical protein
MNDEKQDIIMKGTSDTSHVFTRVGSDDGPEVGVLLGIGVGI